MDELERLHAAMEEAAAEEDYELARRLRDQITLIRGGATPEEAAAADTAGLRRQQPGAMGLGTSQQRVTPPKGWKPPRKPDPMTKGRGSRKG
ncbi:MAG: UvrB/UvrC motif-containing protein [Pseudomonadota bacterium]